jgi:lipopolysaccharide export system protein LptC
VSRLQVQSRSGIEARFATAARHSRRVRFLRVAIPVVVVIALAVTTLLSIFNPWRMIVKLPLNIGNLVVSGTKITMESPRLSGFTPDKRAYELSARAAAQDLTNPNQVELNDMHAKIELEDKSTVQLDARKGVFDTKTEMLKLDESIILRSSTGYEGHLQEAIVDIQAASVVSTKPVSLKLLNGTLDARNLAISEGGDVVRFDGGVSMVLMLQQDEINQVLRAPAEAGDKQ